MHLALVCPELAGHLNPMLTLGRELARRGHRVSLLGVPPAGPKAEAFGLGFLPVAVAEHESGALAAGLDRLAQLKGLAALRLTGKLLCDQANLTLRDAPGAFKAAGVEAVLVDQVSPAGAAVADALGLPFVMICNALAMHQEPAVPPAVTPWAYRTGRLARLRNRLGNTLLGFAARPILRAVNDYRAGFGLPPYALGDNLTFGLAQVAQQPALFDFPRECLPPHFHYTGPWHTPDRDTEVEFPWEKLDGRPLVYASMGTMQNQLRHVFAAILEGCAPLDVQVVLSLGRMDATWDGTTPANAVVVPFAPQLALLDRAAFLITHAGLNTALEGLVRGLPMLCLPVTNDQPGVARRVEYLGAGEIVLPKKATAERVRTAMTRLMTNPAYRTAARRCRAVIAAGPGVARAADLVDEAFRTGRRVMRA